MSKFSLLVIGCGDLGAAVAGHYAGLGWQVWGLRRQPRELPQGVLPIAADVTDASTLAVFATLAPTHVLIALSPGGFSDENYRSVYVDGLRNCLERLNRSHLQRVVWVSSTSIYHQDDGTWVDETSPAVPTGFSGQRLLQAETLLAAAGVPHTSVRFGGIYGPGRDRLLRQLRAGQRSPEQPVRYSNRIHRDDAVDILQFLLLQDSLGIPLQELYLGVDCEPAPMAEVERWFAAWLGLDYTQMAAHGDEARGGNRRCSSVRLQNLGYQFIYPDFRAGLPTLIKV